MFVQDSSCQVGMRALQQMLLLIWLMYSGNQVPVDLWSLCWNWLWQCPVTVLLSLKTKLKFMYSDCKLKWDQFLFYVPSRPSPWPRTLGSTYSGRLPVNHAVIFWRREVDSGTNIWILKHNFNKEDLMRSKFYKNLRWNLNSLFRMPSCANWKMANSIPSHNIISKGI